MAKMVGSYSIRNLIQSTEYLLKLTRSLNDEINNLETIRDEVRNQQKVASKQGSLVKKMTNYMSEELERMELSYSNKKKNSTQTSELSNENDKFSVTESKLRALRERLAEFIEGDDAESLKAADRSLSIELKQYESFLLTLTTSLNEKIPSLEKIYDRLKAEKRESEQQKLLLREMIELFNNEIEDLEEALKEIKE
jgi:DNA repair exonuclease SbcCD ATPase subunit